jgi:hypothetical protein
MDVEEREAALEKLRYPLQVAFAARVGERALAEARTLRPEAIRSYPSLDQGVELVWRHAMKQDVDFERDAAQVHEASSKLIPETEDDVVPDQALRFASQAINNGLLMIMDPDSSANFASSAGEAMISLVGCVYDTDEVEDQEGKWQDRAVELLRSWRSQPISRSMFNKVPEYPRGSVSESYLSGEEE